jgi:hypothetical protein
MSTGPWAGRRGFDSLVQTATGFNHAEGLAAGVDMALSMAAMGEPRAAGTRSTQTQQCHCSVSYSDWRVMISEIRAMVRPGMEILPSLSTVRPSACR